MLNIPAIAAPYQLFGSSDAGDVEGEVVEAGQDAGLLEVVDAVLEDAGRDEDQQDAADGEEPGQVDPDRARVEAEADAAPR